MPMKSWKSAIALLVLAVPALSGCVTPVGPVEVTRFHLPDTSALGKGTISVVPGPGANGASLEWKSYQAAVARQLVLLGYTEAPAGDGAQLAELRLSRETFRPERRTGPVSVGLGGSTGSYGSGVGLGVGINLSGRPPEQVRTELAVTIKDRVTSAALWEGRASFTVKTSSPLAATSLGAPKMAEALFVNFPGISGETIEVK